MTISLSTFEAQVQSLVPDWDVELDDADIRRSVREAVQTYNDDFPDDEIDDVTGDGGKYYPLTGGSAILDNWSEGFSRVIQIEYPAAVVASNETPAYLESEDWDDAYWASDVRYLRMINHSPSATEKMRITYTKPYNWDGTGSTTSVSQAGHGFSVGDLVYLVAATWTAADDPYLATHEVTVVTDADNFIATALAIDVPEVHFFAICYLAACAVCRKLAAKYSFIGDSTIDADSAAHQTKADSFAQRATEYCDKYAGQLGVNLEPPEETTISAGEFVDFDTVPDWPSGRQFIFRKDRP